MASKSVQDELESVEPEDGEDGDAEEVLLITHMLRMSVCTGWPIVAFIMHRTSPTLFTEAALVSWRPRNSLALLFLRSNTSI